jgi:hypothetical protein
MVNIRKCWDDKRTQLLDQAAPILEKLKTVLDRFEDPEVGYFGTDALYVQLGSRGLVIEHGTIEALLQAAKSNDAVLSIDTRDGPLVATIMKHENVF